jgi:urea transporter
VKDDRWLRSAYAWVPAQTAHRGWIVTGLAFFIAVDVANAARTDWTSVAFGVVIAVVLAMRLGTLRGGARQQHASS